MSSNNGGSDGDGGQGGQPTGGQGQPAGGQPQQPQGGQPAGGQPSGGQPAGGQAPAGQPAAGGQPQGGYQGGAQAGYGEGIGDIFSKPTTLNQIKAGIVFYVLAGLGIGIANFMYINQYSGGSFSFVGGVAMASAFMLGPVLAVPIGLRVVNELGSTEQDSLIYGTLAVITVPGNVLLVLIIRMLYALEVDGDIQMGEFFISTIVGGIGAAIVAIGAAYWILNQTGR